MWGTTVHWNFGFLGFGGPWSRNGWVERGADGHVWQPLSWCSSMRVLMMLLQRVWLQLVVKWITWRNFWLVGLLTQNRFDRTLRIWIFGDMNCFSMCDCTCLPILKRLSWRCCWQDAWEASWRNLQRPSWNHSALGAVMQIIVSAFAWCHWWRLGMQRRPVFDEALQYLQRMRLLKDLAEYNNLCRSFQRGCQATTTHMVDEMRQDFTELVKVLPIFCSLSTPKVTFSVVLSKALFCSV